MSFVELQIETDRELALQSFVTKMQELIPGWLAADGDLMLLIAEWISDEYPDLANLSREVTALAFGEFGEQVLGVAPLEATPATVQSTWTLTDADGHTIAPGTQVQITDGDALYGFAVVDEVAVAAGSSVTGAGEVTLRALVDGEVTNGLTADPTLIDALAFVDTITLVGATAGGVDAESEDDYLDRLRAEVQVLSRVLVLPEDVSVAARRIAGVERATTIDNYDPGVNEVQSIIATGGTAGTFTLTYSAQTTAAIAYNATAAAVQSALEALSNIGVGDVEVTGGPLPDTAVAVEFKGALRATNVAEMTVTDSITDGDATVTTVTGGVAASTDNEKMVSVFPIDENGEPVSDAVKAEIEAELEARREIGFVFHVSDPQYTTVDVDYVITSYAGVDEAGLLAACDAALEAYLSPSGWGASPTDDDPGVWINTTTVYINELVALLDRVEGVDRVVSVEIAEGGGTTAASDLVLDDPAPLPQPGTIAGTVS